jgi:hypothetical protein
LRVQIALLITVRHSSVSPPFSWSGAPYFLVTSQQGSDEQVNKTKRWRMIMKTLLSTLVALSVLAGVAASTAQAADFGSRGYWVEHDANMN